MSSMIIDILFTPPFILIYCHIMQISILHLIIYLYYHGHLCLFFCLFELFKVSIFHSCNFNRSFLCMAKPIQTIFSYPAFNISNYNTISLVFLLNSILQGILLIHCSYNDSLIEFYFNIYGTHQLQYFDQSSLFEPPTLNFIHSLDQYFH